MKPFAANTTNIPDRSLRAASRWIVEHSGLSALFLILLVSGLCVAQWWLALQQAQQWVARHPGQPIPFALFDVVGCLLIVIAGVWLLLWHLSGKEDASSGLGDADWWRFEVRERQRIFEGRPISGRLLWIYGLFGLAGLSLAVVLALRLAAAAAWSDEVLTRGKGPLSLVLLAVFMASLGAQRIRDTLFLLHCDSFVGDRAKELAQAVAEEEEAEAEAEREYERKRITGLPYVVFMGGFFGGLLIASRLLPEDEGATAFQASISGLIASVAAVYCWKTKPRGWAFWLSFALLVAVGFVVFVHQAWHRSPIYLLLGALWGGTVGAVTTLLYVRKLSTPGNGVELTIKAKHKP